MQILTFFHDCTEKIILADLRNDERLLMIITG